MSTAAHQPRRVGPSQADSPNPSKVAPRRNPSEANEPNGIQYDSDEVPVLIRLPNIRDLGSIDSGPVEGSRKKRHRFDRPATKKSSGSKRDASKVTKNSFQDQARDNKLVLGGIVGGILVVVALFLFNGAGGEPEPEQDGWATNSETSSAEPVVSLPVESEPPQLYPGEETTQLAGGELDLPAIGAPYYDEPRVSASQIDLVAPSQQPPISGWPSDDAMGPALENNQQPADSWPVEELSLEQRNAPYPATDSPSQGDYRSSMYPSETESYRTGQLDSGRPDVDRGDNDSRILTGKIEIPDTTSTR